MTQSHLILLAAAPLILWRVYKRVQRLTVRQKSHLWRHWCGVVVLPLALLAMVSALWSRPPILASLLAGTAAGAVLAVAALRRTGFERADAEFFYTPYAPIGTAVAMVVVARILYRLVAVFVPGMEAAASFGNSPLTMAIMGVVTGYYLAYCAGLLRWRRATPS